MNLTHAGYQVDACGDGQEGLALALTGAHDLLLVDRMLPGLSGGALVTALRASGSHTPVLMVTALGGVGDRVEGLDAGADDYLVKPFATEELLARIRALSRRPALWTPGETLAYGDIRLDVEARTLKGPKAEIPLSVKEGALLEALMKRGGSACPREALFARVWGADAPVEDGNLDSYVHFLRRRLKTVGSACRVTTLYGVGYRLEDGDV